jgi:hypothetical protein
MFMISKEAMEKAMDIKQKLANPAEKGECLTDIEHMIEVKQSHLWRADLGSCAGGLCAITGLIGIEIGILQGAVEALKNGNDGKAASLLEEYISFLKEHYEVERPSY